MSERRRKRLCLTRFITGLSGELVWAFQIPAASIPAPLAATINDGWNHSSVWKPARA